MIWAKLFGPGSGFERCRWRAGKELTASSIVANCS